MGWIGRIVRNVLRIGSPVQPPTGQVQMSLNGSERGCYKNTKHQEETHVEEKNHFATPGRLP